MPEKQSKLCVLLASGELKFIETKNLTRNQKGKPRLGERVNFNGQDAIVVSISENSSQVVKNLQNEGLEQLTRIQKVVKANNIPATTIVDLYEGLESSAVKALSAKSDQEILSILQTAVTASEYGNMTRASALRIMNIAEKHNVVIRMRPSNPYTAALRLKGHSPKPKCLKMKTINDEDVYIGGNADALGQVGYFKPQWTDELQSLRISNPGLYAKVKERYGERSTEYRLFEDEVKMFEQTGQFRVENGVVIDPKNDLGVTGDYDIFDILTQDGNPINLKTKQAVMRDLEKEPVAVQHGYLMEWKPRDEFEKSLKQKLIDDHKEGPDGKRLVDFYPDGRVENEFYLE